MLCNNKLDWHAGWALCCVENIRFVFVELTENDMNNLIKAKISIWLRDNFQNLCVWFICSHAFRIIRRSIKQFQPCVGLTDLTYKKCERNLLSHATAKPTSAGTPTKKKCFWWRQNILPRQKILFMFCDFNNFWNCSEWNVKVKTREMSINFKYHSFNPIYLHIIIVYYMDYSTIIIIT